VAKERIRESKSKRERDEKERGMNKERD